MHMPYMKMPMFFSQCYIEGDLWWEWRYDHVRTANMMVVLYNISKSQKHWEKRV